MNKNSVMVSMVETIMTGTLPCEDRHPVMKALHITTHVRQIITNP
ncbi:MAG: hypothetical protein WCH00_01185 [Candidatus Saccharibacteria bacterium]